MSNEPRVDPVILVRALQRLITSQEKGLKGEVGKVPAAYTTGNPTTQLAEETAAQAGTKGDRVVVPYTVWGLNAPAASDIKVLLRERGSGKEVTIGELHDIADAVLDAQYWGSVPWAKPGATTLSLAANTERINATTVYQTKKEFQVPYPGRYRVAASLSNTVSSSGATNARLVMSPLPNTVSAAFDVVVSADPGGISSSAYTTFNAVTIDMNLTIWPGWYLKVQIKDTTGANTAYIKDVSVTYQPATAFQAPYQAVVTD